MPAATKRRAGRGADRARLKSGFASRTRVRAAEIGMSLECGATGIRDQDSAISFESGGTTLAAETPVDSRMGASS